MMSLDEVELRIFETYQWFAREAPGVTVREEGTLRDLWAIADMYYAEEALEAG